MITKLLIPHRKGCYAVEAVKRKDWDSPWFMNTYQPAKLEHFLADEICRVRQDKYRGTKRWIKLGCNDPDCPAKLAMKVDTIETLAEMSDKFARALRRKKKNE
jgi:hypothetical protein